MILTDQLNSVRGGTQCKKCKKIIPDSSRKYDWFSPAGGSDPHTIGAADMEDEIARSRSLTFLGEPKERGEEPKKPISCSELLDLFQRTVVTDPQARSAPSSSNRATDVKTPPRRGSAPPAQDTARPIQGAGEMESSPAAMHQPARGRGQTLFHDIAREEMIQQDRRVTLPNITQDDNLSARSDTKKKHKESWKAAVRNLKKTQKRKKNDLACYKKENIELMVSRVQNKEKKNKKSPSIDVQSSSNLSRNISDVDSEGDALETYEFEMMEKKIENDQIEIENLIKSIELSKDDGDNERCNKQSTESQETSRKTGDESESESRCFGSGEGEGTGSTKEATTPQPSRRSSTTSSSYGAKSSSSAGKSHTSDESAGVGSGRLSRSGQVERRPPVPLRRTKLPAAVSNDSLHRACSTPTPVPPVRRQSMPARAPITEAGTPIQEETKQDKVNQQDEAEAKEEKSETQSIKEEIASISSRYSPEIQKELQSLYENITTFEEVEKKTFLREAYRRSVDSSFDSDNSAATRQEVNVVEVEVEINAAPSRGAGSEGGEGPDTPRAAPGSGKDGGHALPTPDDDDDVVFG